jgi:hypothetical protein
VNKIRVSRRGRKQKVRVGSPDASLTGSAGAEAVRELERALGITAALDKEIGPVKQRDRGLPGGQLLVSLASCMLAGGDHLVSLDRRRADIAGQMLEPAPAPASTTAAGLARRFGAAQLAGIGAGVAAVNARVLGLTGQVRRSALLRSVTIDLDATDVEVRGRGKAGCAYNYQGQRCYRPHIAFWAELGVPVAADLLAGDEDPRASAHLLARRALAALPAGPAEIRLRADAGYFAGELAREALRRSIKFAIGAKRNSAVRRAAAAIGEDAWVPAIGMDNAEVAACPCIPDWWPADTTCLVRRVRIPAGAVSCDPRARRRRTIPKDQLALALAGLADHVYGYSFILTNLDVSDGEKIAEAEHWYRHRTDIEALNRDAKLGAALRHMPSGDQRVNLRMDARRAARRRHLRLAPGTHPDRPGQRPRTPHDHAPAPRAHRHPGPRHPPRAADNPAAPARTRPAARRPEPPPGPPQPWLTSPHPAQPDERNQGRSPEPPPPARQPGRQHAPEPASANDKIIYHQSAAFTALIADPGLKRPGSFTARHF